jgi:hypothetical protein
MESSLSVAALVVALAALVVAAAAWRAARRGSGVASGAPGAPPRPEAQAALATSAAEEAASRALEVAESVRQRLDLQEQRAVAPPDPADPPYPRDAVGAVRSHVLTLGYDDVSVLPGDASGNTFVVEARRRGMVSKGRARVGPDGGVSIRFEPATRSFP